MQTRINGVIPTLNNFELVNMFGYQNNGVPGLELIGFGKKQRQLREKIIFLTKEEGLKVPLKRYVICLESSINDFMLEKELNWLELPILILYWSLSNNLPIKRLDDCATGGMIDLNGKIKSIVQNDKVPQSICAVIENLKLIVPGIQYNLDLPQIDLEALLEDKKYVRTAS